MASEISVETVCQFIASHGGKVKNSVLVSNFKKSLNNPESRDVARQKFKECVNTVAVVKTENGDKFVQLKKKYRTPSLSASMSSVNSDSIDASSIASTDQHAPMSTFQTPQKHQEEPPSTHNTSFTPQTDIPYADGASTKTHSPGLDEAYPTTDFPVHSVPSPPESIETYDNVTPQHEAPEEVEMSVTPPPSEPPVKSLPEQRRSFQAEDRKSQHASPEKERIVRDGPPKKLAPLTKFTEDEPEQSKQGLPPPRPLSTSLTKPESGEFAVPAAPRRKKIDRKENVPPSPSLETRFSHSVDRAKAGLQNASNDQGRVSRNRPISIMQTSYVGSVERARLNFQNKQRPSEDTASLALSVDSGRGEGDDDQERTAAPICLDPNEKLWIIKSCQGDMVEMRKLLDVEPNLAPTKDFIMTALHWAAKKGNIDMVNMLLDQKIDVNARSNGGYTPLHLAAMHGKEHVITHLLDYDADPSIRDYSGRQPIHYLKSVSLTLQKLLFGSDGPIKDFAAGLRPRLGSVRNPDRLSAAISGGFGSIGPLVSKSTEDLSKVPPDGSPSPDRRGSNSKDKKMTKKKSKKHKGERPSISIVSFDDGESGYAGSTLGGSNRSSVTSITVSQSSPDLNRSAPTTPNPSQKRKQFNSRGRSHTDY